MKISVIIISHNEEQYLKECLESVINQTQKADEIILIAHNCIDNSVKIAREYPQINTIAYNGPDGIVYARIEGLSHVSGDIILCIDGDSIAQHDWIQEMVKVLNSNTNILVGSWVKFKGTLLGRMSNVFNKYFSKSTGKKACRWLWGPSFAFWKKDIDQVKSILKQSILLSDKLNLSRNPDDLWLALFMSKNGNIEVTNKTYVVQNQKERNSIESIIRNRENYDNGRKIEDFFNK